VFCPRRIARREQISIRVLDQVVCRLSHIDTWTHTVRKRTSTYYALRFAQTVMKSSTLFLTVKQTKIKEEERDVHQMYLCFKQRVEYTPTFELARIWFVVQVFPISQENLRQLVIAILVHVSGSDVQGAHYDPLGASSRRGMDLIGIGAKCTSLFLLRCKNNTTCPA
jgi:hypothetical protein